MNINPVRSRSTIMAAKLLIALGASFLLSGCCEVFGICTSVNVHTAIEPPYQLAQGTSSAQVQPASAPASTTLAELDLSNIALSGL
jgi:hypothetical protein